MSDPRAWFPPPNWKHTGIEPFYLIAREGGIRGWWKRFAWKLWRRRRWLKTNPTFLGRREDVRIWDDINMPPPGGNPDIAWVHTLDRIAPLGFGEGGGNVEDWQ